jgi:hypothetical protein
MNADIIVLGPSGKDGRGGDPAAAASVDYANKPAAANGSCSWDYSCTCAESGKSGGSGNPGNSGTGGTTPLKAPTLCIIVGRLLSDLVVQTQGGKGGTGGPGSNGTSGGQGQDAGTNVGYCLKDHWFSKAECTPAIGGVGGDAGRGGDGGPGGGGGDGGDLYVYYAESQSLSPGGAAYQVFGQSTPGWIGLGGAGGQRGQPGLGGMCEAVGSNPPVRQSSGRSNVKGDDGLNGSPPGNPGDVASFALPPT